VAWRCATRTLQEDILAPRAVIVNPEKRRAAQSLSLVAAVLLFRGIAQINNEALRILCGGVTDADRR
jgi:hypothetical protein